MKQGRHYSLSASRLFSAAVVTATTLLAVTVGSAAEEGEQASPQIEGVWQLHAEIGEDGEVTPLQGPLAEAIARKFFADGQWCVIYADPNTGVVQSHHGGTYTLKGDEYAETIKYAIQRNRALVGKTFRFKVEADGETYTQKGVDNPYSEVWKRVKNEP